jgi:hypothetical protein
MIDLMKLQTGICRLGLETKPLETRRKISAETFGRNGLGQAPKLQSQTEPTSI